MSGFIDGGELTLLPKSDRYTQRKSTYIILFFFFNSLLHIKLNLNRNLYVQSSSHIQVYSIRQICYSIFQGCFHLKHSSRQSKSKRGRVVSWSVSEADGESAALGFHLPDCTETLTILFIYLPRNNELSYRLFNLR